MITKRLLTRSTFSVLIAAGIVSLAGGQARGANATPIWYQMWTPYGLNYWGPLGPYPPGFLPLERPGSYYPQTYYPYSPYYDFSIPYGYSYSQPYYSPYSYSSPYFGGSYGSPYGYRYGYGYPYGRMWNRPGWNRPGWNMPGWNRPGWFRPGWQGQMGHMPGGMRPGWHGGPGMHGRPGSQGPTQVPRGHGR